MEGDGFRRQPHTRAQGNVGEDRAVVWLKARGYRVIERNYTCRGGEIDVVAWQGEDLCFVEIKARANSEFGSAIEAISATKQKRLAKAAAWYLVEHPTERPCRFDVLAMDLSGEQWNYTLVQHAFSL